MEKYTTNTPFIVAFLYKIAAEIKRVAPRIIAHYIIISLCVALSFYIISLVSPAIGEAWAYNATVFAGILTAGMLGLIAVFGTTVAVWLSGIISAVSIRQISKEIEAAKLRNGPAALPIGDTLRLGADIVLIQWPGENDAAYAARIQQAKDGIKPGSIIACLKWKWGYIPTYSMKDSECKNINRAAFDTVADIEYTTETEAEFQHYVNIFQGAFMAFSADLKTSDQKVSPFSTFEKIVNASANVAILLLLSVVTYGQNTAKIHAALGANDMEVSSGTVVNYTFTGGQSAMRTADKATTISSLFVNGRAGLESLNVGELEGVSINGKAIELQKKTIQSTGTPDKPAALYADAVPVTSKPLSESIPDSAAVARSVQKIINDGDGIKSKVWKAIAPVWVLFMWVFGSLFWVLFGVGGLFWYMATTARENGNLGYTVLKAQRWASRNVLFICWSFTIVILVNVFLQFVYMDWPLWAVVLCWCAVLLIAKWVTNIVTPNGQNVHFEQGIQAYEQKQLHSGKGR